MRSSVSRSFDDRDIAIFKGFGLVGSQAGVGDSATSAFSRNAYRLKVNRLVLKAFL